MLPRQIMFIVLSFVCFDSYAGVYKCTDDTGAIKYQGSPCDKDSKVSEQLNIDSTNRSGPVKMTQQNKKNYELAIHSNSMEFTASECKRRYSSYSDEVAQASERLYEIRKFEIDAGKEILQRGFPGLPPSEMASLRNEGKKKMLSRLSKMSKNELDRFCSTQARRARNLAAIAPNRSSGYVEGDLDPEGND